MDLGLLAGSKVILHFFLKFKKNQIKKKALFSPAQLTSAVIDWVPVVVVE